MKLATFVKTSFIFSFLISVIGVWLMIKRSEGAEAFLTIGLITGLMFIVAAINEVRTSLRIDNAEKRKWTTALILFSPAAGLIYFFISRRRIATNY